MKKPNHAEPAGAADVPFEYVFVNADGSVREVNRLERLYLSTRYHGSDGDRPFIKARYREKNGSGTLQGFCLRRRIPRGLPIEADRSEIDEERVRQEIERIRGMGYEVDLGNGTW